jgi:antirestriction protein ArdC
VNFARRFKMRSIQVEIPNEILDLCEEWGVKLLRWNEALATYPDYWEFKERLCWSDSGFYNSELDLIVIAEFPFHDIARVVLHEIGHWTGQIGRLNRKRFKINDKWLKSDRSERFFAPEHVDHTEEVVAERVSFQLARELGICVDVRWALSSKTYIEGHYLADYVKATREADRAVNYLMDKIEKKAA